MSESFSETQALQDMDDARIGRSRALQAKAALAALIAAHARARCTAKRVYGSWSEAEAAALVLTEDLRDGKLKRQKQGPVTAYQCAVCNLWHIGHCRPPSNPWNHWHRAMSMLAREAQP